MINVDELKEKIINFLKENGPALPIKVAKAIEKELVFTSALLGELTANHKIKTSNMRIGASQIYYISGQEEQLEPYADEHFSGVVKKAYLELKEKKYLVDSEQEPAMRVALRSIKDFATPFQYKEQVMWRYNFFSKEDILKMIEGTYTPPKPEPVEEKTNSNEDEPELPQTPSNFENESEDALARSEDIREDQDDDSEGTSETSPKDEDGDEDKGDNDDTLSRSEDVREDQDDDSEITSEASSFESPFVPEDEPEKPEPPKNELTQEVLNVLNKRAIPLIETLEETKSEFMGVIRIRSELGSVEYLVAAKTKKTLNDEDVRYFRGRAIDKNMPCLILYRDKITKAGQNMLEDFKNLIKAEKLE